MSLIGIIPAKGYSERFKGCKNLALWRGKSLVQHAVDSVKEFCDRLVVLTDSEEIIDSIDDAKGILVNPLGVTVLDTVREFHPENLVSWKDPCTLGVFLSTCPMRTRVHSREAIHRMGTEDGVVSVCRTWSKELLCSINPDGSLLPSNSFINNNTRQQDQPMTFRPNGAIYLRKMSAWRKHPNFFSGKVWPYVMSEKDSIDIDYQEDMDALPR